MSETDELTATEMVKILRDEDPDRSAASIAAEMGITRARVGQILRELGLPTRPPRKIDWLAEKEAYMAFFKGTRGKRRPSSAFGWLCYQAGRLRGR